MSQVSVRRGGGACQDRGRAGARHVGQVSPVAASAYPPPLLLSLIRVVWCGVVWWFALASSRPPSVAEPCGVVCSLSRFVLCGVVLSLSCVVWCGVLAEPCGAVSCCVVCSGKKLKADCLLYTVGRQGNTANLGLDKIGLAANKRGLIAVNDHYQTTVGTHA
jgi:hypothetical protein